MHYGGAHKFRFHFLSMPALPIPLTTLAHGQSATLTDIRIPTEERGRLLELGLTTGTAVELVRFAPLGDPVEIKVRGYHLTLRKHEADQIFVTPCQA
jgi:ferrous iron transport protein A